jgi:hypothetical protein
MRFMFRCGGPYFEHQIKMSVVRYSMETSDGRLQSIWQSSIMVCRSLRRFGIKSTVLYRQDHVPQFEVCFLTGGAMELYKLVA